MGDECLINIRRTKNMLVQEFEGKNKEEAIKTALDALNLKKEEVRIEYIDEGKVGFFGFRGGRPARIKVYYEEKESETSKFVRQFLEKMFKTVHIDVATTFVKEDKETIHIKMDSEVSGLIIGKKGKTLEAIQFLVNVISNKNKEDNRKVILDIESYRSKREEAVKRLALQTGEIVRKTGKSKLLDPMNPFERRLVHLTLQDFEDLETKSEGDGIYKKVRIFLKGNEDYSQDGE